MKYKSLKIELPFWTSFANIQEKTLLKVLWHTTRGEQKKVYNIGTQLNQNKGHPEENKYDSWS